MPPRKSAMGRLLDFFHEHPRGRLVELVFFAVIGLVLGAVALVGAKRDWFNEPLAWLLGLVALCFVLFAALPQKKRAPPPPPPKGKRGAIAEQVKASKSEKRKGPPPPIH